MTSGHSADDIVIGFMFIFTTIVEFVFYLPCMIVLATDREMSRNSCFKIMFHLGIVDFVSMTSEIIAGIWSISGWSYNLPYWLNKIVGAWGTSGFCWYAYIALVHLLALNRCSGMCFPLRIHQNLFSPLKTKIWLRMCYFYAMLWTSLWLSPWASIVYFPDTFSFYFDPQKPLFFMLAKINLWNCIIILGFTTFWYAIIVLRLRVLNTHTSSGSVAHQREMQMLKLATVICVYIILNDQYWHTVSGILYGMGFGYAFALGNYLNVLNAGVNPLVYLTMNRKMKRKVRRLLGLPPAGGATSTATSTRAQTSPRGRSRHLTAASAPK